MYGGWSPGCLACRQIKYCRQMCEHVAGLIAGNVTIDDLVFPDGTTRMGVPGGDAVYSSIGAGFWGVHVHVCSVCGSDYPLESLSSEYGLHVETIRRINGPSMRNWGLYEDDGSRLFVLRDRGYTWSDYSPVSSDLPLNIVKSEPAHIATLPYDHQLSLARALRDGGCPLITLDPHYEYMSRSRIGELCQGRFRVGSSPSSVHYRSSTTGSGDWPVPRCRGAGSDQRLCTSAFIGCDSVFRLAWALSC